MPEFAVRELVELQKFTNVPSLERLLDSFGEYASPFRNPVVPAAVDVGGNDEGEDEATEEDDDEDGEEVLAEIDLDDEFMDAIDELEEEEL